MSSAARRFFGNVVGGRLFVPPAFYQTFGAETITIDAANDSVFVPLLQECDGALSSLSLHLATVTTGGDLTLELYAADSDNEPSSTALASLGTLTVADTDDNSWVRKTFTAQQLYRGNRYGIMIIGEAGINLQLTGRRVHENFKSSKTLSGAVSAQVKIPCTGHGFSEGDVVTLENTTNYDGDYTLPDQSVDGTANIFIIEASTATDEIIGAGTGKDIDAEAAADSGATTAIPCTGHGFSEGDTVKIVGTAAYDATYTLPAQSSGVDDFDITTADIPGGVFVAETFDEGTETAYPIDSDDVAYIKKALAGDAVDLTGTTKIPCVGHGFVATDTIKIANTDSYDGTYTLPAQTGGDADNFIVTSTDIPGGSFAADTFDGNDIAYKEISLDAAEYTDDAERTKIPCTGHGFSSGDYVWILNTTNYDGGHVLSDQSGGGADNFYIDWPFTAETLASPDVAYSAQYYGSCPPDNLVTKTALGGASSWSELTQNTKPAYLNIILNSTSDHVPPLMFGRYNGNSLYISEDNVYEIPVEGVTLDCSALTAETLYHIYIYRTASSGGLALEATTTAPAVHEGIEVKTGDTSRRHIGWIYPYDVLGTGKQAPVDIRDCRTLLNRHNQVTKSLGRINCFYATSIDDGINATGIGTSWEPLGFGLGLPFRASFLSDGRSSVWFEVTGLSLVTAVKTFFSIAMDGTSSPHESAPGLRVPTINYMTSGGLSCMPSPGFHYVTPIQKGSAAGAKVSIKYVAEELAVSFLGQIQC